MSITTVQGVIDGLREPQYFRKALSTGGVTGRWLSGWYVGAIPVAGGAGSTTPGNALTAPVTGQIPFLNPASGESLLARFAVSSQVQAADYMLVDRLWHMSGISPTTTTAQTVSSAAWPARDINQSTNGEGVYIALQATAAGGAGTPSLSMTYTNSAGTGSKVGANIHATAASPGAGSTWVMGLAAGDTGVRSVQNFTLSVTWTSGSYSLIAFRPIAYIPNPGAATSGVSPGRFRKRIEDALTLAAPRIWDGSVLELWAAPNGSSSTPAPGGSITISQG